MNLIASPDRLVYASDPLSRRRRPTLAIGTLLLVLNLIILFDSPGVESSKSHLHHNQASNHHSDKNAADNQQQNDLDSAEDELRVDPIEWPQESSNDGREQVAGSISNDLNGRNLGSVDLPSLALEPDPFAFTFEDYLCEAARPSSRDGTEIDGANGSDDGKPETSAINRTTHLQNQVGGSQANRQSPHDIQHRVEPAGERIDFIFPAPRAHDSGDNGTGAHRQPLETRADNQHEPHRHLDQEQESVHQQEADADGGANLRDEIRVLFAWRALPTNKCTKSCGKGHRVNHVSCIDLKFSVRVEDELCVQARLVRPDPISDEPCNEIDCEPSWDTLEYQQCNTIDEGATNGADCKLTLYRRLECRMVNKLGQVVHLDEGRCAGSPEPQRHSHKTNDNEQVSSSNFPEATGVPAAADFKSDSLSGEVLEEEKNDIMPIVQMSSADRSDNHRHSWSTNSHDHLAPQHDNGTGSSNHHRHDESPAAIMTTSGEPYYVPGPWSQCSGATCGKLGRRRRKLTCRMYLARSAKYVDLPESSCQGMLEPDHEEPCYIDCGPETMSEFIDTGTGVEQEDPTLGVNQAPRQVANFSSTEQPSNSAPILRNGSIGRTGDGTDSQGLFDDESSSEELIYDTESARWTWRHVGWTACSAQCLGGKRESIVECWDKIAETSVDPSHCQLDEVEAGYHNAQSMVRPEPLLEKCNDIPCTPEWRVEPFSSCSHPCGSSGIRRRSVACVQQVPLGTGQSSHMLVSNDLCIQTFAPVQSELQQTMAKHTDTPNWGGSSMPHQIEPCNRFDCPPEWKVGPWSECDRKCGEGTRNRTVICVQEFASREGPTKMHGRQLSPDLREAISISAKNWHPGKETQVPFQECHREHKSVPQISERCNSPCQSASASFSIDSDPLQDYQMIREKVRRKTVTLKVGGRARLIEGRNVKIRCRVTRHDGSPTGSKVSWPIVWRKDGVRIFANNSTVVELQHIQETDNSILSNDVLVPDDPNRLLADEPEASRIQRLAPLAPHPVAAALQQSQTAPAKLLKLGSNNRTKTRDLRLWARSNNLSQQQEISAPSDGEFQFVPQVGGRFSLVKENTLRIKRLKLDDSGIYTCSNDLQSESIEITVVSKHHLIDHSNRNNEDNAKLSNRY